MYASCSYWPAARRWRTLERAREKETRSSAGMRRAEGEEDAREAGWFADENGVSGGTVAKGGKGSEAERGRYEVPAN